MRAASWKDIDWEDCPNCGGSVQVLTTADAGYCHDGDNVRCTDCGFRGGMSVDEDGSAWVQDV